MKRLTFSFCAAVTLICTILFSSCDSHTDRLLNSLPYHHRCVLAAIDLDYLGNLAGAHISDDGFQLSEPFRGVVDSIFLMRCDSVFITVAKGLLPVIDRSHILYYNSQDGQSLCTFCIIDARQAKYHLTKCSNGTSEVINGYQFFDFGTFTIGMSDDQGWLFTGSSHHLTALLDESNESNLGSLKGISDYVEQNKSLRVLTLTEHADDTEGQKSRWHCATIDIEDNGAHVSTTQMFADGTPIPYPFNTKFSTDFLRYFPADFNVIGALSLRDGELKMDDIDQISDMLGLDLNSATALLRPFLTAINGPIAFGACLSLPLPSDTISNLRRYFRNGILMVHMSQEKIDEVLSNLRSGASLAGLPFTSDGNGAFVMDLSSLSGAPFTLYAASSDSYLIISTYPAQPVNKNDFDALFDGNSGAMMLSFDNISGVLRGCDYGVDFSMKASPESIDFSLAFPGTEKSFPYILVEFIRHIAL